MSAAECWYANRNFKGIDDQGKPREYKRGEPVPGVADWPTFASLRNINWIVAKPVKGAEPAQAKPVVKQPEKEPQQSEEKPKAKAKKAAKKTEVKEPSDETLSCEVCGRDDFGSSRALKVHMRYH